MPFDCSSSCSLFFYYFFEISMDFLKCSYFFRNHVDKPLSFVFYLFSFFLFKIFFIKGKYTKNKNASIKIKYKIFAHMNLFGSRVTY